MRTYICQFATKRYEYPFNYKARKLNLHGWIEGGWGPKGKLPYPFQGELHPNAFNVIRPTIVLYGRGSKLTIWVGNHTSYYELNDVT